MDQIDVEQLFFKSFNIKPIIKKGEKYLDNNCRFVERIAEEDIYPTIDILKIEDNIGTFLLERVVGPQDSILYKYKNDGLIGRLCLHRKEALLYYLIDNKDHFDFIHHIF